MPGAALKKMNASAGYLPDSFTLRPAITFRRRVGEVPETIRVGKSASFLSRIAT